MTRDITLGIHYSADRSQILSQDGNCCLMIDGQIVGAIAQERVTRIKYDGGYREACGFLLDRLGVAPDEVTSVSVSTWLRPIPPTDTDFIAGRIRRDLGVECDIRFPKSHHEVHALGAVGSLAIDRALVAVVDHSGSVISGLDTSDERAEQSSFYLWRDQKLDLIDTDHQTGSDAGLGRSYSQITRFVGFASYQESGKTMGLSSFGCPTALTKDRLYTLDATGSLTTELTLTEQSSDGLADLSHWFQSRGVVLQAPRDGGSPVRQQDMDLAAWGQHQLALALVDKIRFLLSKRPEIDTVVLAGGVALNSVASRFLTDHLNGINVFTPSAPSDSGLSIGAALWCAAKQGKLLPERPTSPYLGPTYSNSEISRAIENHTHYRFSDVGELIASAAEAIAAGRIIGWYQGGSEFGPRALGNRSILASPTNAWTRDILNQQVKKREWFRPYAPVVLVEHTSQYFETTAPEPYMMRIANVKKDKIGFIPACVHVDGSARLQTVHRDENPLFHRLISALHDITGIPVVLNTSFNLDGMPIVETPNDAVCCFEQSGFIDELYIDQYVIRS